MQSPPPGDQMAQAGTEVSTGDQGQVQEPAQVSQPTSQPDQGQTVPVTVLQEVRRELQEIKRENDLYRNAFLNNQFQQQQREPEFDPEEPVTAGQVDAFLERKLQPLRQQAEQDRIRASYVNAKVKYPDFDKMLAYADALVAEQPWMQNVIMSTPDPAIAAYNFGRTHPDALRALQSQQVATVVSQVQKNLNQTPTLSGSASTPVNNTKDFASMSADEFAQFRQSVMDKR